MKKFLSVIAVLLTAFFIVSCDKDVNNPEGMQDNQLVKVSIIAGNPTTKSDTKTLIDGGTPKWSVGDAIGVSDGTSTNYKFTTDITSPSTTATFTGTTSVSSDLYAYYPYNSLGVSASGAKVEIPVNQNPTATSFDGAADVMISRKFTVDPAGTTVSGLEFARAGAIIKVVFKDNTTGNVITGQHPNIVSITSSTANLVGRLYLNFAGQSVGELYGSQSKTVNANYTPITQYSIDGTNGAYIIVYPQTLATGTDNLTITANTEGYSISKTVSVPASGIKLDPGKLTTLNVSINDENIAPDVALSLPFDDDFSWLDGKAADGTAITGSSTPPLYGLYSTGDKLYTTPNANEIRIGNSSSSGFIVTKGINLSSASHITVSAKQYGSDVSKIKVSVDGGDPIDAVNDGSNLGGSYRNYIFNLPASSAKSKVKISTSAKRAYVNSISIEDGSYVPPAEKTLPYDNSLIGSHTDFSIYNVNTGSLEDVWTNTSYGVQASAYGTTSDVETYLVSPLISLTGVSNAILSFDHSINFFADVATAQTQTALQIKVGDGDWTDFVIPTYPTALGNTFVNAIISLDAYCGNVITLRFKYLATSTNPGRWQIKNFLVKEATHSISATPNPAVIGGSIGSFVNVTATSDYGVTYSTTGSGFTVTQDGKTFKLTATSGGGASESTLGTLVIEELDDPSVKTTVTVKQDAVATGETLPFNWDGGKEDGTANMIIQAGSDYASSPKVKFQTANSHYIIVRIAEPATTVSFVGKNNGTANGNHVTLQGSVDGTSYTNIQEFTIASGTNTYTSTESINESYRYIKLILTTKASSTNTAMGTIHIE